MGVSMEMMPEWRNAKVSEEQSYPENLKVNKAHQGNGNAVCQQWRTSSLDGHW